MAIISGMELEKAKKIIEEAIGAGKISGGFLSVGRVGEIVAEWGAGLASAEPRREIDAGTLFDAGTLTEPLATVSIFAALTSEKKLNLNSPAAKIWPDFSEEGKDKVSIRHLLKHTSGLAADRPFFRELIDEHPDWAGTEKGKSFILGRLSSEQLEYPPTYSLVHSELGYMALGHLAELISGEELCALFKKTVATPLLLSGAIFSSELASDANCAAVGPCPRRGKMLAGEPADANAWVMGGAAGHSGLFITPSDAARIGLRWASSLAADGGWLARPVVADFIGPKAKYKMGWELPTRGSPECGGAFPYATIGHVSRTGLSLWIDLDEQVAVAFFATFLSGVPAWDPASVKAFSELLPPLHDAVREGIA